MSRIVIEQEGENWVARHNDRRIGKAKCKPCIVNIMRRMTMNSSKYDEIVVLDGMSIAVYRTGERSQDNGRKDQENQAGE